MPKKLHESGPAYVAPSMTNNVRIGAGVPRGKGKDTMGGYKLSSAWKKMKRRNKGKTQSGDPDDYPPISDPDSRSYSFEVDN